MTHTNFHPLCVAFGVMALLEVCLLVCNDPFLQLYICQYGVLITQRQHRSLKGWDVYVKPLNYWPSQQTLSHFQTHVLLPKRGFKFGGHFLDHAVSCISRFIMIIMLVSLYPFAVPVHLYNSNAHYVLPSCATSCNLIGMLIFQNIWVSTTNIESKIDQTLFSGRSMWGSWNKTKVNGNCTQELHMCTTCTIKWVCSLHSV